MSTTIYPRTPETTEQKISDRIRGLYTRYEKYTGLAVFSLGFLWDSLTLTRVDSLIDNLILLFYLVVIAGVILLIIRRQCGKPVLWLERFEHRFAWVMQFCFGGLFSSYVIFYFKSASFSRTQFFFLILVILWIGNEFLEERLKHSVLLSGLYCFCLLSFFAFFLPVMMARFTAVYFGKVDTLIFLSAGILSLSATLALFSLGFLAQREQWRRRMVPVAATVVSVVLAVNILYFANLIPPVPLTLKTARIYHRIVKTPAGYEVKYVPPSMFRFWRKWDSPFYFSPGERVYCYTAIFAPGGVYVPVRHVWSHKTAGGWVRTDGNGIGFEVTGGREGGFRGYTDKGGIYPGEWRVEVQTERGRTLGLIDFKVLPSPDPHPALVTAVIR